jgi:hypothetical protein
MPQEKEEFCLSLFSAVYLLGASLGFCLLLRLTVSQSKVGQLEIAVVCAGGGIVDDGLCRPALMLPEQILIDPEAQFVIVAGLCDATLGARLVFLYVLPDQRALRVRPLRMLQPAATCALDCTSTLPRSWGNSGIVTRLL